MSYGPASMPPDAPPPQPPVPPIAGPPPGLPTYYEPLPKRRISRFWLVVAIVAGVGLLSVVGVVALVAIWWVAEREQPVTAADRETIVTADDLARFHEFRVDSSREKLTKTRSAIDGTTTIDYEYDDEADDAPYLTCCVTVQPNVSDARADYAVTNVSVGIGLKLGADGEIISEQRNDLFRWGDQSEFCLLKRDGFVVGNTFVARKGKRTFSMLVAGIAFEDGEVFGELVEPPLRKLESYRP